MGTKVTPEIRARVVEQYIDARWPQATEAERRNLRLSLNRRGIGTFKTVAQMRAEIRFNR